MRKLRTSPLNEGELDGYLDGFVITAEDASQTDLDGKRVYNSRVGALDKLLHKAEFGLRL